MKWRLKQMINILITLSRSGHKIPYCWGAGSTALPIIEIDKQTEQRRVIGSHLPVMCGEWIDAKETPEEIEKLVKEAERKQLINEFAKAALSGFAAQEYLSFSNIPPYALEAATALADEVSK